jgi:hypothetical protein
MGTAMNIELNGMVFMEEIAAAAAHGTPVPVRQAIPVAEKREVTALDYCLDVWIQWQRRDDTRLGWRGKCALVESDYDDEFAGESDALYSALDTSVAEAVEAVMKSLPRHLDWAIRQRCRIATVWRFPSLVFADVLSEAEDALAALLRKNIATRCFFV